MKENFRKLLSQYVGPVLAKQAAFEDFISGKAWDLDLSEGKAVFGDKSYPIHILGVEIDGDLSWQWVWANEDASFDSHILDVSREIRSFGEAHGVDELVQGGLSKEDAGGNDLAVVASGLVPGTCYCRGPHEGGALYFLVGDISEDEAPPLQIERLVNVINEVVSQFDVDHRVMLKSFFSSQGFEVTDEPELISASREDGTLRLGIGDSGRICKLEGEIAKKKQD